MSSYDEGRQMRDIVISADSLESLELAFDDATFQTSYYLDVETGDVIPVTEEFSSELESIRDDLPDAEIATEDEVADAMRKAIEERGMPEWEEELLLEAYRVESEYGTRYIGVPNEGSREGYHDMQAFIRTVEDERLQDRLWRAIDGRGAFRYFKDVLYEHPEEQERWFEFKHERLVERVREWLESEGLRPEFRKRDRPTNG